MTNDNTDDDELFCNCNCNLCYTMRQILLCLPNKKSPLNLLVFFIKMFLLFIIILYLSIILYLYYVSKTCKICHL